VFCVGAYLDRVRAASSRVPSLVAWSLVCTDSTVLHTIFESNLPPHRHHPYQGRCGDYHKDCIRLGNGPLAVNGLRCHLIAAAPVASPKAVLRWWHTVDPSDPLTEVATAVHFSSRWAESFTRRAPPPVERDAHHLWPLAKLCHPCASALVRPLPPWTKVPSIQPNPHK